MLALRRLISALIVMLVVVGAGPAVERLLSPASHHAAPVVASDVAIYHYDSPAQRVAAPQRVAPIASSSTTSTENSRTATLGASPGTASASGASASPISLRRAAKGGGWLDDAARSKIPSEWGDGLPNTKGVGTKWEDPAYQGNGVRIDQGNPNHSLPSQQVDHVVVRSGGKILGPDGQPITGSLKQNPQAHIPLSDWLKWTHWNAP